VSDSRTILQKIASGDAAAVQECIDQYSNLVWSLARRFTPSAADAEDAVQDVFLDLWKSAGRFDPARSSETTFVAMVARRRLIDQLRRAESRPKLVGMPEHFDAPDEEHRRIEASVEAASAARALSALKPEQRRVLMLSIYEGMSHGEIVKATGIPLGTVKSHIRRGLAEIRARLSPEDTDAGGTT
jgi:RNA polymerase sigma-70 factor (ECF subfamily)